VTDVSSEVKDLDRVCITFDIDWAPDDIIKYIVELLEEYQIKATFFATHKSTFLKSLDRKNYEVGLHPNFERCNDYDKAISDLKRIYPEAVGARAHGLVQSTRIYRLLIANGLKYDVTTYIPLRENLYPWVRLKKLVVIPSYLEDDSLFLSEHDFTLSELQIDKKGLKIYDFHPIHVFMNTQSIEHYKRYKPFYHEPDNLINYKGKGRGIQTLFTELLQLLQRKKMNTYTCEEICKEYLVQSGML